jgi:hypothetical protein
MQLPRGTFREIKKNVTIESLLAEIEHAKFSGISSISSETITGTLVFKTGKCILVKFQNKQGDRGWDELRQVAHEEVDVALSSLDDAQVQLSLEFNKSCRVVTALKPVSPVPQKPSAPAHQVLPVRPVARKTPAPAFIQQKPAAAVPHPHHASVPVTTAPAPEKKTVPLQGPPPHPPAGLKPPSPVPQPPHVQVHRREVPKQTAEEPNPADTSESSSFDDDIDTFDTLDLDNVTDKIRNDCKTMIKDLNLDHLMDR